MHVVPIILILGGRRQRGVAFVAGERERLVDALVPGDLAAEGVVVVRGDFSPRGVGDEAGRAEMVQVVIVTPFGAARRASERRQQLAATIQVVSRPRPR